jgi:hypothetical protein
MKRFLIIFFIIPCQWIHAQEILSDNRSRLENKARQHKTTSLVCGGLGIVCIATSAVLSVSELNVLGDDGPPTGKEQTAGALGLIGFTSLLAGIGFHLASKSSKKKAKALSLQNNSIRSLQNGKMNYHAMPTLSLKFTIGK